MLNVPDLRSLSGREVLDLFGELEAPAMTDLKGEYAAITLAHPTPFFTQLSWLSLNTPVTGRWVGKAFDGGESGGDVGRGYNNFRRRGRVVQCYPMITTIAPSRFDGKPSFQLVYRGFHGLSGACNVLDEVRKVDEDRFLGIGTCGFTPRQRMIPQPFQLLGPRSPYKGDIGRPRAGFDLQEALVTHAKS
ncbi:MAG: hypothetical protein JHC87_04200 [Thermoleophilaceae bacterium]|nr:hypothetical protein [Thermoleophilaceae bacterium]